MPDGSFTPERAALHDRIVEQILGESSPVENPASYMMGGGPASGKSSITDTGKLGLPDNIASIDSDAIKKLLPEFDDMLARGDSRGASFVHDESSILAKRILTTGIENGHNTFLDGTGDSSLEALKKKTDRMRKGGRRVIANYVSLDTDTAQKINHARFEKTGRLVPEAFLRQTHANISEIFPQAMEAGLFDEVTLWDTNIKDEPFKMVEHKDGKTTILDQVAYDRFLSKANA
jgi:predicted ABC-type ATPase